MMSTVPTPLKKRAMFELMKKINWNFSFMRVLKKRVEQNLLPGRLSKQLYAVKPLTAESILSFPPHIFGFSPMPFYFFCAVILFSEFKMLLIICQ